MRDLLRYILIAVLVVIVGWFLIGELKDWTIVDNSVTVESDAGWELLFNYSTTIDDGSYLHAEISSDSDFKDYDVYCVNFIVASPAYDSISNSHFLTLDESSINFTTIDVNFFTYTYSLWMSINGYVELDAAIASESEYYGFDFSVKIWGVK